MRILMTGGTGLVGRQVAAALAGRGDSVVCVTRDLQRARSLLPADIELIEADPKAPGPWQQAAAGADAVINLAGENLAEGWLWTGRKKLRMRRSRLRPTTHLAQALHGSDRRCVFVSASATGYYGDVGSAALTEDSEPGHDFLAMLVCEWERAALAAQSDRCRVVCLRLGVILAPSGGVLARLVPVFRRGFGGPLGSGRQYFPWIDIRDLVRIFLFALDSPALSGPVNATVPDPPQQRDFARALGRALGQPAHFPTPALVLRLLLGEKASVLLSSQRVVPSALRALGFHFEHTDLDRVLPDLVGGSSPVAKR